MREAAMKDLGVRPLPTMIACACVCASMLSTFVTPVSGHIAVRLQRPCYRSADPGPPSGEPFVHRGRTSLISGLFLDGGPLRHLAHCRGGIPSPGTVEVLNPTTKAVLARRTVAAGQLARIPLRPGTYLVKGIFADATSNGKPIESQPVTVKVAAGTVVRQDTLAGIR